MDGIRRERLWRAVTDSAGGDWARGVCQVCVAVLTGVASAALSLRTESRAQELLAASDGWGARLEEEQYTLGEGPGVAAFATGGPVLVADLAADQARWPGFAEAALSSGAAAAFAFPMQVGMIRLGTLALYRRRPGGLAAQSLTDAVVLADLATTALLRQTENDELAGLDALRPVNSYQDVNVATGMLAARLRISLDDAFARLRAHAFMEGRSVLDVAQDVVQRRISLEFPAE
ncbi:GAF and ANTAR domain-containing protein [Qaidamihabitans albus]|uniref:GAF and ANTAR domain-containing protein n=1 Tax=Qaidamihabitans albus TaxID=2795733 RepID=UPI0027DB58F6|nr:ANTAR domain-containing protein [Qaidamihabitans albus]